MSEHHSASHGARGEFPHLDQRPQVRGIATPRAISMAHQASGHTELGEKCNGQKSFNFASRPPTSIRVD